MKRLFIVIGVSLAILVATITVLYGWIGHGVKKNIEIAQSKYPGDAEDALISYLQDQTNSPRDRTHIAIWTLGQIDSKKALPILHELYKNDPKGKTCLNHHDSLLCQYEIHKAINSIEKWKPMGYGYLKSRN